MKIRGLIIGRVFLLALLLFGGAAGVRAEEVSQEYQLKLAFMVNFARFITWPETSFSPDQPQVTLCLFDKNPFGKALAGVVGKKVGDRSLTVKTIEALGKEQQCHLLFVDQPELAAVVDLNTSLHHQPVVTVSDLEGFAASGGGIEFVLKNDKLSFIINNSALKEQGVQVGSSLLNLAASVR